MEINIRIRRKNLLESKESRIKKLSLTKPLGRFNFAQNRQYYMAVWGIAGVVVLGLFLFSVRPENLKSGPASSSFINERAEDAGLLAAEENESVDTILNVAKEEEDASNDDVETASLAAVVSQESELLVASNVTNYRDTLVIQKTVAPIQGNQIDKPQTTVSEESARAITEYQTVEGDTIPSVAEKFGVSADTIRWANDLVGDSVAPGTKLKILPITGVLVVSSAGDTAQTIASRTGANAEEVALFNDIAIDASLPAGQNIIAPNGVKRAVVSSRSSRGSSGASYSYGGTPVFGGGNTYSYGYCTWHAANRRAAIGRPIPNRMGNAITWASKARSLGYAVDGNPRAGDVLWHKNIGGYGHVAFVESVNSDGSILVSDMNYRGWNRISYRTVSPGEFGSYLFIH